MKPICLHCLPVFSAHSFLFSLTITLYSKMSPICLLALVFNVKTSEGLEVERQLASVFLYLPVPNQLLLVLSSLRSFWRCKIISFYVQLIASRSASFSLCISIFALTVAVAIDLNWNIPNSRFFTSHFWYTFVLLLQQKNPIHTSLQSRILLHNESKQAWEWSALLTFA